MEWHFVQFLKQIDIFEAKEFYWSMLFDIQTSISWKTYETVKSMLHYKGP